MANYHVVLPFTALGGDPARLLKFSAELGCATPAEARRRGLESFRDLALSTGLKFAAQPNENDVFIEDTDPRDETGFEVSALEYLAHSYAMKIVGGLDSASAMRLDKTVFRLQHQKAKSLAIDLGQVHPLSSAGLGVLLNIHDRLEVRLVRVPIGVRKMIQTLGLDATLTFYDSFPDAIRRAED